MPKYNYSCSSCEQIMEISHSMTETITKCEICGKIDTLRKVPNIIATQYKNESGKLVTSYIEEAKKQIQEQKEFLQKQDYKK